MINTSATLAGTLRRRNTPATTTGGAATTAGAAGAAAAGGTGYSQLLAAASQPLDTAGIARQAHTAAFHDVGTLVTGIRQQQAQINADAQARAREIQAASLGAAKYLQGLNLGHGLSDSLKQAAGDQSSLAAGFSGQLQQTVGDAGAKVSAALDQLHAPGGVPSTAAQAGNTVYGLGGLLPANAMLAAAPYAQQQADSAPGQLVGYGQQEAIGALGAGKQQAQRLDSQITTAQGKLPALEHGYLSDLTAAATKGRQDQIGNVIDLTKAGMPKTFGSASSGYFALDPTTGGVTQLTAAAPGTPVKPLIVGSDRQGRFALDPVTGKVTQLTAPVAGAPVKPIIFGSDKAGRFALDPTTGQLTQVTQPIKPAPKTLSPGKRAATLSGLFKDGVALAQQGMGKQILGKLVGRVPFPAAYQQLVTYFQGAGVTNDTTARRLALRALGAAGYPLPGAVDVTP